MAPVDLATAALETRVPAFPICRSSSLTIRHLTLVDLFSVLVQVQVQVVVVD